MMKPPSFNLLSLSTFYLSTSMCHDAVRTGQVLWQFGCGVYYFLDIVFVDDDVVFREQEHVVVEHLEEC